MKQCSICKVIKTTKNFYKDKSRFDGLQYKCKDCDNKRHADHRIKNKNEISIRCHNYYLKNIKLIKKQHKNYRNKNNKKIKEYSKLYFKNNKEKIYRYIENNIEKIRELRKEYRKKNINKITKYLKLYYKQNRKKYLAHSNKYKISKINRTPEWSDLKEIERIYNNCPNGYHVDHIIPLQGKNVSGLHVPQNLQYLTRSEN